jgi:NADH:ubiquinone oxidoreductase subunit 3 (subunit A)
VLTAIDISLLGWLAQSYDEANLILLSMAIVLVVIVTFGIIYANKKAYEKIKKLGDL